MVQVVDGREGPVPLDAELAQLLRRAGKPPVLAVNKVDSPKQAELAAQFYELGDEIFPISAEHGYGIDAMLDSLTKDFPDGRSDRGTRRTSTSRSSGGPTWASRRCLISSSGAERSIVSPEPGTTRDTVDTVVERHGKTYRFLDTAGIRRKGKTNLIAEKLSVIMARNHLERADIAVLMVDASRGRYVSRRDNRELCGAIGPVRDHRDEQMGSRAASRAGKGRAGEKARRQRGHGRESGKIARGLRADGAAKN